MKGVRRSGEGREIMLTVTLWRPFSWLSEPEASSILPERRFSDMIAVTAESDTGRRVMERRKLPESVQVLYITPLLSRLTLSATHCLPFNFLKLYFWRFHVGAVGGK